MPRRSLSRHLSCWLLLAAAGAGASQASAATPGEATDLVVTGFDEATGNISFTWTPACSAADHHMEFGLLEDVASYAWSGQECGIGVGGAYTQFNPGPGSYFFVVVGDDGAGIEGSYGTSFIGGVSAERPDDTLDPVCTRVQDLSQRCDGPFVPAVLAMTAYRPTTGGASGAAFLRRAVPESEELTPGAGIRVNGDDDNGNAQPDRDDSVVTGENDLIEVVLAVDPQVPPSGFEYALIRTSTSIRVWASPTKDVEVVPGGSAVLTFMSSTQTVWVENPAGGLSDLELVARSSPGGSTVASDSVHVYPFTSVIIALGGEGQVPADPPLEPTNHGMFQLAITLHQKGYDVHMYDEDVVPASGAGAAFNEVASAIQNRGVGGVAIFGYSHGGGSTNDLARRLDAQRATLGTFSIDFTAYVDGIDNDSDFDIDPETALPPTTGFHANWYQHPGCGFLQLCGGPVSGADINVNVTATPWGAALTHFTIDDAPQLLSDLLGLVMTHVVP
ncbi:MAG: hypothetical protein ACREAA_13070 [Candidatus Polarisedimenticolia bacterium]